MTLAPAVKRSRSQYADRFCRSRGSPPRLRRGGCAMTGSPDSDFGRAVERTQRAVAALLQGDPEPEKELWSRRDEVTLANPFGGYRRGWPDVEAGLDIAADGFAKGGTCVFE